MTPMPNRLAAETSPYLLQHQHNPVDWYPWGEEAFNRARAEDKPIFLSVGYSTCYWCHVMERQSFENQSVAAEMNQRFVNIKVDREERPDVDQLYMNAVQVLTRQGGWPMSVFLTPDLKPFYGGTYFPPQDMYGRPGFVSVLRGIEQAYRTRKSDVDQTAAQLVNILQGLSEPEAPTRAITIDEKLVDQWVERSTSDYEMHFGGFGSAPKFPRETLLEMLLIHQRHSPNETRMKMIRHALDAMAYGGIRDQLGGGFHRYSTDQYWLVPHFEIMLYDNAMLAWCYIEAYRQTEERFYAQIARGIFDFVLREMTSPDGAFYTAFDAEVDAQEGLSYLWTTTEILNTLGPDDAKLFNQVYGVDQGPNFSDPHHGTGTPDKSILFIRDRARWAQEHDRLEPMRQKLKAVRDRRKQPLLDTKMLTSWNALMIRAFACGGAVLNEPRYLDAAAKSARFLLTQHRPPDGGLFRTSREGSAAKYAGFLDDYAYLVQALLEVRQATGSEEWKDHAAAMATAMVQKFEDSTRGGFFFTEAGAPDLIVRQKTASDSPLPSGNAVAAMAMLELDLPEVTKRTLQVFAGQLERGAEGMSALVEAAHLYVKRFGPIEVAAAPEGARRQPTPQEVAANIVDLEGEWVSPTELRIHAKIQDEFHINAHQASTAGLTPTKMAVSVAGATIDYPPGEDRRFPFADESLRVYEKTATFVIRFKLPITSELTGQLTYQACTNDACLPPIAKEFDVPAPPSAAPSSPFAG
jgi:uncharacterized protein YyaL (SSP411 family)